MPDIISKDLDFKTIPGEDGPGPLYKGTASGFGFRIPFSKILYPLQSPVSQRVKKDAILRFTSLLS